MARFGIDEFGRGFFGEPGSSAFAVTPFIATEENYGDLRLTYNPPSGSWLKMRLVRNFLGYPVAEDDGDVLFEVGQGDPLSNGYHDTNVPTARWVYYSIFVFATEFNVWIFCGRTRGYSVKDFSGGERVYDLIPRPFKGLTLDAPGINDQLLAFASIFGFTYDVLRNLTNSLLQLRDPLKVNYDLVPLQMLDFGIPEEFELEPEQYRRFLANAVFLYKTKGTTPCVHGVVSAVTGYDSLIGIGANMLWGADFSDFLNGIGTWEAADVHSEVVWHHGFVATIGQVINTLRITSTLTGHTISAQMCDPADVKQMGIVVVHGRQITFGMSISAISATTATGSVWYGIDFYDVDGNFLEQDIAQATDVRQLLLTDYSHTFDVPDNAVWAVPRFLTESNVDLNDGYDITKIRMSYGTAETDQYGHDIRIVLRATRINEVHNPSFEIDDTGWLFLDATGALDTTTAKVGTQSLKITPTAGTGYGYAQLATRPGFRYGVQISVSGTATGSIYATAGAPTDTPLEDADGTPGSAAFDLTGVTFGDDVVPTFTFVATSSESLLVVATDADVNIDAVIVEIASEGTAAQWAARDAAYVKPYFDGDSTDITDDYFWEGDPQHSRSHFYYRRAVHEARLRDILPRYLPIGATYTLLWAQPDEVTFLNEDVILVDRDPEPPTARITAERSIKWRDEFTNTGVLQLRWDDLITVTATAELVWDAESTVTAHAALVWDVEVVAPAPTATAVPAPNQPKGEAGSNGSIWNGISIAAGQAIAFVVTGFWDASGQGTIAVDGGSGIAPVATEVSTGTGTAAARVAIFLITGLSAGSHNFVISDIAESSVSPVLIDGLGSIDTSFGASGVGSSTDSAAGSVSAPALILVGASANVNTTITTSDSGASYILQHASSDSGSCWKETTSGAGSVTVHAAALGSSAHAILALALIG